MCDLMECNNDAKDLPAENVWCSEVKDLWNEFGDVPMDPETECIEVAWRKFPVGTHREEIWHWFEETFRVRVYDLMYS